MREDLRSPRIGNGKVGRVRFNQIGYDRGIVGQVIDADREPGAKLLEGATSTYQGVTFRAFDIRLNEIDTLQLEFLGDGIDGRRRDLNAASRDDVRDNTIAVKVQRGGFTPSGAFDDVDATALDFSREGLLEKRDVGGLGLEGDHFLGTTAQGVAGESADVSAEIEDHVTFANPNGTLLIHASDHV